MTHRRRLRHAAFAAVALAAADSVAAEAQAVASPERPAAQAAPAAARTFAVVRASSPVKIDATLDEAAWAEAPRIDLPYEFFPGDNTPSPVTSDCRVTYDHENLYLGCLLQDPEPRAVRANITDRDPQPVDDYVELYVDPFNDQRRAYIFRVNPLGVQTDATFSAGVGEDLSWDAIWNSAGRLTAEGYAVEAAIPFKSLRFPSTTGPQTWGMIVGRNYPRSVRHRIRSMPTDRNEACLLCQADKLAGLEDIRPGRDLEFTPTLTTRREDVNNAFPNDDLETGDVDPEFGITARWGITPNANLGATINPDFSQVEADVAQFQVNERFAIFYPEKRPFFLEGADIFGTPLDVVYTRTVVDPRAGLKLTGKEGRTVYGGYAAQDRVNSILLPSNAGTGLGFVEDEVNSAVLRFRRDVGRTSTLGAMYTGRMSDDYYNHVAGVDGFFRLGQSQFLRAQVVRSETQYPDEILALGVRPDSGSFGGNSVYAEFIHQSRSWIIDAIYEDRSRDFRADAGFVPRVDIRGPTVTAERVFWGAPNQWYRRLSVLGYGQRLEDHDGRLTDLGFALVGNYSGRRQLNVNVGAGYNKKYYAGQYFEMLDLRPGFDIRPNGRLTISASGRFGEEIDFANARKARIFEIYPGFNLKVGRNLDIGLEYSMRQLQTLGEDTLGGGLEIVDARITEGRVVYHFNARTFVRGILQYQDTDQNPDVFGGPVQPEVEELFAQLLFAYKVNPQTVLFLGYTDDRVGLQNVDLTPTGRTFFMKVGYNFRL